jgi:hypothetical protein
MTRLVLCGVMMSTIKQLLYSGPSYATQGYAKRGRVDDQAPIKTASEMIIRAPVERV